MREENRTNKSNKITEFQIHTKPECQFTWKQSTVGISETPQTRLSDLPKLSDWGKRKAVMPPSPPPCPQKSQC